MFSEGGKRSCPRPPLFWDSPSSHSAKHKDDGWESCNETIRVIYLERTLSLIPALSSAPSSSPSTRRYLPKVNLSQYLRLYKILLTEIDGADLLGLFDLLFVAAHLFNKQNHKTLLKIESTCCCSLSTKFANLSPALRPSSVLSLYSWIPGKNLPFLLTLHLWQPFCRTCWHRPASFSPSPTLSQALLLADRDEWPANQRIPQPFL